MSITTSHQQDQVTQHYIKSFTLHETQRNVSTNATSQQTAWNYDMHSTFNHCNANLYKFNATQHKHAIIWQEYCRMIKSLNN